jgi:hypothetical protein
VSFYDEVMREMVLALGGALFLGSAWALIRRRADANRPVAQKSTGSRNRTAAQGSGTADLAQAPLARTVTYMLIGLIVAGWALASMINR